MLRIVKSSLFLVQKYENFILWWNIVMFTEILTTTQWQNAQIRGRESQISIKGTQIWWIDRRRLDKLWRSREQ